MLDEGTVVDRYTIGPLLGEGGMGRVYRARDTRLGRDVALKVVTAAGDDGEEARRRLLREARTAAALDHHGAVSIFDVGEVDGTPYIVMELVAGESLRAAIGRHEHDERDALRWLLEVARVLEAAHAQSLVHRDIKPENVMLRPDGSIRVLDFGIARRRRKPIEEAATTEDSVFATLTQTGIPVGTPLYMAPEQIRGETVDHRTDQFAWGVMAYELLTGEPPWPKDDSLRLIASILTDEPPTSSRLRADVAAIVHRTLAKRPEDRFAHTGELVAALEDALADRAAPVPRSPSPEHTGALDDYSAGELGEILERALLRQPIDEPGLEAGDLIDAAHRMGVDPATLDEAASKLSAVRSPHAHRQAALRGLRVHAAVWAACAVFFFLLNMVTDPGHLWFYHPVLAWGLGLAIHAIGFHLGKAPPQPRPRFRWRLRGKRPRTGLGLEPAVRRLLEVAGDPNEAPPARAAKTADSHATWDARFAARRIESRGAGGRIEAIPDPDEAQAAEAGALAEEEQKHAPLGES